MKRILTISLLLALSTLAMEEKVHEPSKRTRTYVGQALRAFNIPLESVKIYGFTDPEGNCGGWANSDRNEIAINESLNDLSAKYNSFHEAAHIKDHVSQKIPLYAKYLTASVLGVYLSIAPKLSKAAEKIAAQSKFRNPLLAFMGGSYGITGILFGMWFHDNAAIQWAHEQGEYRADKMAIEKLLEQDALDPILKTLSSKKELELAFGSARIGGHRPARTEYKAMKKTIEKHGYKVSKYRLENDLRIDITKNGYGRGIQVENFYSKV